MLKNFIRNTSGNFAITTAICTFPLMIAAGIALDYSRIADSTTKLQHITDAAALAGAAAEDGQENLTATDYFSGNNVMNITPEVVVENDQVSVTASYELPMYFMGLVSQNTVQISANSIAGKGSSPNNSACIYVLNSSDNNTKQITASGTFNSDCGVQVNSSSPQAFSAINSGTLNIPEVNVVGNYSVISSGTVNTEFNINQNSVTDPLANIDEPSEKMHPCDSSKPSIVTSSGSVTLTPGVYCGGLSIFSSGSVTMEPGVYVFRDGNLNISLSGTLTGTELLFYFQGNSAFTNNTSGTINLTSQTSGPQKGILIFQGRDISSKGKNYQLNLSGSHSYTGAVYTPDSHLQWNISGTNTVTQYTPIITDTISVNMSGEVNLSNQADASIPIPDALNTTSGAGGEAKIRLIR